MASTSSSSVQKRFKYDVFLSFRGEDTRNNFVSHLHTALVNEGFETYKDDVRIEKGGRISDQLIGSIKDSRFHIIVFSTNYADSSWCLDELVEIMECQKTTEQTAYPVFYKVEPTQIRKQCGPVGKAFAKLLEKEAAGKWRKALIDAAGLAGWEFQDTLKGITEAQFIQEIVVDISLKLDSIHSSIDKNFVDMETRVNDIVSSLKIDSDDDDVRMIGIKGIGGCGKTTLARAVYNNISSKFESRSFVENVGVVSEESSSGLMKLQNKLLQDVLKGKSINVTSVTDGTNILGMRMRSRKILIVLDDVHNARQLKALAGSRNWFKPGSRIIVTTRDEQVLNAHQMDIIHDVKLLSDEEAICLFSRCAFKREIPHKGYEELSNKVVYYADGLPITVTALGLSLCGNPKSEWEDAIRRLNEFPEKETREILKTIYDRLEDDQKEIFLDVACIFKGERKDKAIRVLESCGFRATYGLSVLQKKSLITISSDGHLGLHKHLEEMGRNIVRSHLNEPQQHSRLWIQEEIKTIFTNDLGTAATRSIKLAKTNLSPDIIMKGLEKMTKLRFIHVDNGSVDEVYSSNASLPDALRYVYWRNYPFCCLPITFLADNPQMARCKINHTWKEKKRKVHTNLRCLHLKNSHMETFDFEATENLETLYLRECKKSVELLMTNARKKLKILDLRGSKVRNLNLSLTPRLEKLSLLLNKDTHLLESICKLEHLKCLKLALCKHLKQLPTNISKLEKLEELHLTDCSDLEVVPNSICEMRCLRSIHLPYIRAQNLPDNLGKLKDLEELNLEGACITELPKSIREKKGLRIVGSMRLFTGNDFESITEITKYTAYCIV